MTRRRFVVVGANPGQRILDLAQRLQDRLFVVVQGLFGLRPLDFDPPLVLAGIKNRCEQARANAPYFRIARIQVRQVVTGETQHPGQAQRRKTHCDCRADPFGLRRQGLLGLAHIGPSDE